MRKIISLEKKIYSWLGGRKFIIEIVATIALFCDKITGEQWVWVSGFYMGINGITKFFSRSNRIEENGNTSNP